MCEQKTCKKCGGVEFYKNGQCKACQKARNAAYYAMNADTGRARSAAYRKSNPDAVRLAQASWQSRNKEKLAEYKKANSHKCRAYSAAWYAKNSDAARAKTAKYRQDHPEKAKASCAKWRAANRDKLKAISRAWVENNRDKRRNAEKLRRARKRAGGGKLSPDLIPRLMKLQRGKCACCRASLDDGSHLDHVIALALGGPNVDSNMQLLCGPCNMSKGAKHPVDFMQSRGFLL